MFGEELHYRVRDVADLHDLSLRGNFVRVEDTAKEIQTRAREYLERQEAERSSRDENKRLK